MIFIIGGVSQGKTAFAESLGFSVIDDLEGKIREWMSQGIEEEQWMFREIEKEVRAICNLESKDSLREAQVTLISREIGCGIVPMEAQESLWRELTGRMSCRLAQVATDVYKMEAGIAVKIK